MSTISHLRDVTLFAPSNAAFEEPGVQKILQDKERVKEMLNLHYVKDRLPIEKIKNKSVNQVIYFYKFLIKDPRITST